MIPEASSVEPTTPSNPRASQGCDLDEIRTALAARKGAQYGVERHAFNENAPTWLAALCDEIERLRASCPLGDDPLDGANCHLCGRPADTFWVSDDLWQRVGLSGQVCFRCFRVAAWHVEIRPESNWFVSLTDVVAERDAALAEIERLDKLGGTIVDKIEVSLMAWRACAEQLAADLKNRAPNTHWSTTGLAEYERLKEA